MEAKYTVMTWKQTVECSHNPNKELRERDICLAQAEISFKAGIKEVVEFIKGEGVHWLVGEEIKWRAKLKEWGIGK